MKKQSTINGVWLSGAIVCSVLAFLLGRWTENVPSVTACKREVVVVRSEEQVVPAVSRIEDLEQPKRSVVAASVVQKNLKNSQNAEITDFLSSKPELMKALTDWMARPDQDLAVVPKEERLAQIGSPDAVMELIKMLAGASDDAEQRRIMAAASTVNNPEAAEILLETLRATNDSDVQVVAQRALDNMADEGLFYEMVERYYASGDVWERVNLEAVIRQLENKALIPAMVDALSETDWKHPDSMSKAMLCTLADMGTPEALNYLESTLPFLDEQTGEYIQNALAQQ